MSDQFDRSDIIDDLERYQAWNAERERRRADADVDRLRRLDAEIAAERAVHRQDTRREPDLFKAMHPANVERRISSGQTGARRFRHQLRAIAGDLAEVPPTSTIAKAQLMSLDLVAARETLRQAAINGEAPALDLIKAERLLNQLEGTGGMMKSLTPSADDRASEAHCRRLLNEVVAAGLPAVEAAKYEALIHRRFG
jgi:hypothetical protein